MTDDLVRRTLVQAHGDPQVPNHRTPKRGPKLLPGLTIAIGPMVNIRKSATRTLKDKWTIVTTDGSRSAPPAHGGNHEWPAGAGHDVAQPIGRSAVVAIQALRDAASKCIVAGGGVTGRKDRPLSWVRHGDAIGHGRTGELIHATLHGHRFLLWVNL